MIMKLWGEKSKTNIEARQSDMTQGQITTVKERLRGSLPSSIAAYLMLALCSIQP